MRVTGVEEISKNRCRVYLDEEFAFALYRGELRRFHLKAGEELSEEDYHAIVDEILLKRARQRALYLLKSRDYTTKQLRDKLRQSGYPDSVIEKTAADVDSLRYTDDLRYAVNFISYYAEIRSRRRMEQDLFLKGIGRELFDRAWADWEEQGGSQNESAMIRELLKKRHYDPETADYNERQKQAAFLMRRGFSAEQIRKVICTEEAF